MNYKEHYRIDAEEFDYWGEDQLSATETRRNETIFRLAQIRAGQSVLDIGSGRGWFSLHAASQGAMVTAMDLSERNLERIRKLDSRISTLFADACESGITDQKYDLIVALEVLEHIVDPALAVNSWKSLLKPQGRMLICVPYKEAIRYSLCIHCNQKTPWNAHLHSFDRYSLGKLLTSHGLRLRSTHLLAHKLLPYFRLDKLCRKLPYYVWQHLDHFCNITGDKYSYMAVICSIK
jgi:SAM-dependent methyltransferase